MKSAARVCCLFLAACAPSTANSTWGSSGDPLEAGLDGTWTGVATFSLAGRDPIPYSVPLTVAVTGESARINNICQGLLANQSLRGGRSASPTESASASSHVILTGSGRFATSTEPLECAKIELRGCDVLAVTYSNVTLALTRANQLTLVATGNAVGCSLFYPVFMTLVGFK